MLVNVLAAPAKAKETVKKINSMSSLGSNCSVLKRGDDDDQV